MAKFLRKSLRKTKDTPWVLDDDQTTEIPQSQTAVSKTGSDCDDPPNETSSQPESQQAALDLAKKSPKRSDPDLKSSKKKEPEEKTVTKTKSKKTTKTSSEKSKKPSSPRSTDKLKSSKKNTEEGKLDAAPRKTRSTTEDKLSKKVSEKTKPKKSSSKTATKPPTKVGPADRDRKKRTHRRRKDGEGVVERENPPQIDSQEDPQSQNFDEDWSDGSEVSSDEEMNFVGGYSFNQYEEEENSSEVSFSCLSPEDIIAAQKKQISEIAELLVISVSAASNLLRSYGWQSEKLLAKYFDNPDQVLKEAGLLMCGPNDETEARVSQPSECLVCTDMLEPEECCAMSCGHVVCKDCWGSYLSMKINEGEVYRVCCPAVGCNRNVPDELVKKLVERPIFEKYLRFLTKSFVEDNNMITWCPFPGCRNAITSAMVNGKIVECACGYRFCFSCHHEAHAPASCDQVRQWQRKCNDDSETGHWLGANTKGCPRCNVFVEKNGGCNHMTCRQCAYEWCWMCTKIWKGHEDFYACARYEKSQKKKEKKKNGKKLSKIQALEAEREAKRVALERYMGYYDNFLFYDNMIKHSNLKEKAQARVQLLQSEQTISAELKFIAKATDTVSECLEAIKYSYVYGYFLEDGSTEKGIFTILQEELLKVTVALKEILESPTLLSRRTEAVDLTKIAQKKKDSILHGVTDPM